MEYALKALSLHSIISILCEFLSERKIKDLPYFMGIELHSWGKYIMEEYIITQAFIMQNNLELKVLNTT